MQLENGLLLPPGEFNSVKNWNKDIGKKHQDHCWIQCASMLNNWLRTMAVPVNTHITRSFATVISQVAKHHQGPVAVPAHGKSLLRSGLGDPSEDTGQRCRTLWRCAGNPLGKHRVYWWIFHIFQPAVLDQQNVVAILVAFSGYIYLHIGSYSGKCDVMCDDLWRFFLMICT